jgi:hypothetical protein
LRTNAFTPFGRRSTDEVQFERNETIALYNRVRQQHYASIWSSPDIVERISNNMVEIIDQLVDLPSYLPLARALDRCLRAVVAVETTLVSFPEIEWNSALLSMQEGVDLRRFLRAKEHFLANEDRVFRELQTALGNIVGGIIQNLPPIPDTASSTLTVPLFAMMQDAGYVVSAITDVLLADGLIQCGLFTGLQDRLYENVCEASGVAPYADTKRSLIVAEKSKLPAEELLQTYLGGTPFLDLLTTPIPFTIPHETRFAGHWIIAPPGRGKTTLLHHMFLEDLPRDASIIVMDSKGDLINPIKELKAVQDRLVLIEPDAKYPLALNPLDVPRENIQHAVALIEYILSGLLEAKFTNPQASLFRHVLPAIMQVYEHPTIDVLKSVLADGLPRELIPKLDDRLQRFFTDTRNGFESKTYAETRSQIIWRLDFILTNDTMRAMFESPTTRLKIAEAMNSGKIIIIDASKAILGDDGSEFYQRFFLALILGAAQARSVLNPSEKLPVFCYLDECQWVRNDQKLATILDECRSQKIALILAHQRTDQITNPNVLSAMTNCAIRFANSDDEAKFLAPKLRCEVEFLQSLRVGKFAAYVRDYTQHALALDIPYHDMRKLPRMTTGEQNALRDKMRAQYANPKALPAPRPTPQQSEPKQSAQPKRHQFRPAADDDEKLW